MDGDGIGQHQLVQIAKLVVHGFFFVKKNTYYLVFLVYARNNAKIPVKDFLVVVVFCLHDLVANTVAEHAALHLHLPGFLGIEGILQAGIHILRAHAALVHGGKELNVLPGIKAVACRYIVHDKGNHVVCSFLAVRTGQKEKVRILFPGPEKLGHYAVIDEMGIGDNGTGLCLAENLVQLDDGNPPGRDNVAQNGSRAY